MTRIFFSYRYTGVPKAELNATILPIVNQLRKFGFEVFCNLEKDTIYQRENWNTKSIMRDCFLELNQCDYHITFVAASGVTGEGMMIELGYALKMGVRTLLIMPTTHHGVTSKAIVDNIIIYISTDDLMQQLDNFNFAL
jgi:nucleoside 2-deoxyribosyltransferase